VSTQTIPDEKIVLVDKCAQLERTNEYLLGLIKVKKVMDIKTITQEIHINSKIRINKIFLNGEQLKAADNECSKDNSKTSN